MMDDVIGLLRCPRTRSRLAPREDGALVSVQGGHVYPLIAGIYDFRLFDPPYMNREDESRLAKEIDAAAAGMGSEALLRHYELQLAPSHDAPQVRQRHVGHRLALRSRAPKRLLDMLGQGRCAVPPGDGVFLDLGCGSGEALVTLMAQGAARVVGVDISLIELVLAKKLLLDAGRDALLVAGCAEALPFAEESFDFIYSPDVIEHVASQPDYLGEAYRVLKVGGRFLLNSPNRYSLVCPEPHVGLWFLTFLPRRCIDPVCRLLGKGPYVGKRLVSLPELRQMLRRTFGTVRINSREANPHATSLLGRAFYMLSPYSERVFAYIADQHVVLAAKDERRPNPVVRETSRSGPPADQWPGTSADEASEPPYSAKSKIPEKRVRCLLVTNIFPPIHGGSAVVYESLARFSPPGSMSILAPWRHYANRAELDGWQVHDAAAGYPISRIEMLRPPMTERAPHNRVESAWRVLTIDLPLYARVLRKVVSVIRREKINLLCIGELASGSWIGLTCKRLLGIPYINYIHGEEVTIEMPYRRHGRNRRGYLHRAAGIVAVSEFTAGALVDLMGVPRHKIRLIHNGVDIDRFNPSQPHPEILARHGLTGHKVILSVGRLIPRKGFDRVIEAMPSVLAQCPDAHYLLVGDGDYRPELERLAASLGLRDRVTFAGTVSTVDLPRYYQSCDLFVMPNREMPDGDTEGFGLVFLEANACHKAVVSGRVGGVGEAVRDGQNGLVVDGNEPGQIAAAVLRILRDDTLRKALADRGLEQARSSSWQQQTQLFQAFCHEIVNVRKLS